MGTRSPPGNAIRAEDRALPALESSLLGERFAQFALAEWRSGAGSVHRRRERTGALEGWFGTLTGTALFTVAPSSRRARPGVLAAAHVGVVAEVRVGAPQ